MGYFPVGNVCQACQVLGQVISQYLLGDEVAQWNRTPM
jgi:hypothetical protein